MIGKLVTPGVCAARRRFDSGSSPKKINTNQNSKSMNKFELEMERINCSFEHDILRIKKSMHGIRCDWNRRIWQLKAECHMKLNGLEAEHLSLKKKLYTITDMQVRFGIMQRVSELERNMRHYKRGRDIRIQEEKNELAARMEEMSIEIRTLRNERDKRLLEVRERYIDWIDNRKNSSCNEAI